MANNARFAVVACRDGAVYVYTGFASHHDAAIFIVDRLPDNWETTIAQAIDCNETAEH